MQNDDDLPAAAPSPPPPPPPPPPPTSPSLPPPGPAQPSSPPPPASPAFVAPPEQTGGWSTGRIVLVVVLAVLVLPITVLSAIAVPAFLNQRERAWQAELTSATRNAALEVEAAATMAGGDYRAAQAVAVAEAFLAGVTPARLVVDSSATFATSSSYSLCVEHDELEGSVTYASADGGLQDYSEAPCP